MPLPAKIVLVAPVQNRAALAEFVEACLRDGVELIAAGGPDADHVELAVDLLCVGDGGDDSRFICTTAHASVEEACAFAELWSGEGDAEDRVDVVRL